MTPFDPRYRFARMNAFNPNSILYGRDEALIPTRERFSLATTRSSPTSSSATFSSISTNAAALEPGAVLRATWFMFDKAEAPMMHDFQHALYNALDDPTHAVIYDRDFLRAKLTGNAGLSIFRVEPPALRGFQWIVRRPPGLGDVEFPRDDALLGHKPPPR